MPPAALYDVLAAYQNIHQVVLKQAERLTDEQLRWKPDNYSTSIGFHLWHMARESDYLKAAILEHFPALGPDFGVARQIWHEHGLSEKWGFPTELGLSGVGTGVSDEVAANLPIPPKEELLDYLRRAYADIEAFLELLDTRHAQTESIADADLKKAVERSRVNVLTFMLHDARHLGMIEVLTGLQTGFGSATETRRP
jgi:hypothetical protein